MPTQYRIDPELGAVFSSWSGRVTMEEAVGHYRRLEGDPDFHPDLRHFSDARRVTEPLASEDVRRLAKMSPFSQRSRRAVVVADDAVFGVSRMYEAQIQDGSQFGVFWSAKEALAWLGLPPDLEGVEPDD